MEEYDIADPLEERTKEEHEECEAPEEEVESIFTQSWQDKLNAMRKLKENAKRVDPEKQVEPPKTPTLYEKEQTFWNRCADKNIPYLEDNKSKIEMLLSAWMLIMQTYILSSITIVNMVQTSVIENEVFHDMLSYLMERGIMYQHYCIRLTKSHEVSKRLKAIFDPYKSVEMPCKFNKKLDEIYEKALDKYMKDMSDMADQADQADLLDQADTSAEQETVDGGSNTKKTM